MSVAALDASRCSVLISLPLRAGDKCEKTVSFATLECLLNGSALYLPEEASAYHSMLPITDLARVRQARRLGESSRFEAHSTLPLTQSMLLHSFTGHERCTEGGAVRLPQGLISLCSPNAAPDLVSHCTAALTALVEDDSLFSTLVDAAKTMLISLPGILHFS